MVVVDGALFPCEGGDIETSIWYCILPDISTALDMLLWYGAIVSVNHRILWFVTIVAGIWHISPPDDGEIHIVKTL